MHATQAFFQGAGSKPVEASIPRCGPERQIIEWSYRYSATDRRQREYQQDVYEGMISTVFAHFWYVSVQKAQREELYTAIVKTHSIFDKHEERESLQRNLQVSLCRYPEMFTSSCSGSCPESAPCGRRC